MKGGSGLGMCAVEERNGWNRGVLTLRPRLPIDVIRADFVRGE